MIRIGLTGSIGMGKSTTAQMFCDEGIPVYDADQTVHDLYAGEVAELVEAEFPGTLINGQVNRAELGKRVLASSENLKRLEAIIHPLVHAVEEQFIEDAKNSGADAVLLDIPLLFETGGENRVDVIVVVTAPDEIQRERVKLSGLIIPLIPAQELILHAIRCETSSRTSGKILCRVRKPQDN